MNLTRRDLARLTAAAAFSRFPRLGRSQDSGRTIGYCIVGLGRISMQHFMPGARLSQYSKVTALVSGHRDKAERMAAEYHVPAKSIYSYEQYDAIAQNKDIDAVYIALPNSMHAEYSIRGARAGKHVLCEKPMCTTVADAEAMIEASRRAGKKLMIAYRCQYEPLHQRAIRMIRDGTLGKVQAIESSFGFNIGSGEWRTTRKLGGGGPLMDVGIYCLNACRYLTGEEPAELKGYSSVTDHDGRFAEVEEHLSWTMKFPSGAVAACNTSYGVNMPGFFRVHGAKGMLHMEPAFNYDGVRLSVHLEDKPPIDTLSGDRDPAQFPPQADHLAECIFQNKEPKTPGEEGLRDMKLMTAIYRSC